MKIAQHIPASPDEVEGFANTLTPAYLHCRVWGHDATPRNIVVAKHTEGVPNAQWDASLVCSHGCGVRWRVLASLNGEVLRRRPDYSEAPEYLSKVGRINREGRQILTRRYFEGNGPKRGRKRRALDQV